MRSEPLLTVFSALRRYAARVPTHYHFHSQYNLTISLFARSMIFPSSPFLAKPHKDIFPFKLACSHFGLLSASHNDMMQFGYI